MESAVYLQFKVNIENLVRSKVHIAKNFHIQPSEIDKLPFWEYEYMLQEMTETIKKEQESQEKQNADANGMDLNAMQRKFNSKIPNMSSAAKGFSLPKI